LHDIHEDKHVVSKAIRFYCGMNGLTTLHIANSRKMSSAYMQGLVKLCEELRRMNQLS
jgi:hypothetical protein